MEKTVTNKWETEGQLAVLYKIDNVLLFYTSDNDPQFKKGQKLTLNDAQATNFYNAVAYNEDNLPSDVVPALTFMWS